jgi:hypothetical protein
MKANKQPAGRLRRVGKYDKEPPVMKKILTMQDEVSIHLAKNNRTLDQELLLIFEKKSTLPTRLRRFVMSWYEFQLNQQKANEESENQGESTDDVRSDLPDELHPGE